MTPKAGKKFGVRFPWGALASRKEIAGPVLFLCTEYASFITGEIFNVNWRSRAGGIVWQGKLVSEIPPQNDATGCFCIQRKARVERAFLPACVQRQRASRGNSARATQAAPQAATIPCSGITLPAE